MRNNKEEIKQHKKKDKQKWLIISNAFNRDGRADSQTITDKIPHLLKLGVEPVALSALTGEKDEKIKHYRVPTPTPVGLRFDLRHYLRQRLRNKFLYRLLSGFSSLLLLPFYILEKAFITAGVSMVMVYKRLFRRIIYHKEKKADIDLLNGRP